MYKLIFSETLVDIVRSFIRSFIRSFVHSFVRSFVRSRTVVRGKKNHRLVKGSFVYCGFYRTQVTTSFLIG